jgi:hypothetical protein
VILRLLVIAVFQILCTAAHACRFAQDAQPEQWQAWSSLLFAADVESIDLDQQKSLDVITVSVVKTFKGPPGAVATLLVPTRMWASCRLARPLAGARVLVAINPNGDTLLVPLTEAYSERLRQQFSK